MRRITTTVVLFALFVLCVSPVLADLSFEQGLTDWTVEHRQDSRTTNGHEFTNIEVTDRFSDGSKSVRLGAMIVDDGSPCMTVECSGQTQTIVWKGPYDLSRGLSISVDMTDFQRAEPQSDWGWGIEACLILSDGTHETRAWLRNYHEENTGKYGPPGLEDNMYDSYVVRADGTEWFRYRRPLAASRWYPTDFGGGYLPDLDLSHVWIGVVFAAENWNSSPQTLWVNGLVDNLRIEYNPIVGINVDPKTLNLKSKGGENSITVVADFPFNQINAGSLRLNGVPATSAWADGNGNLICKFDRQALIALVVPSEAILTLTGQNTEGVPIVVGSDTIRVINPGK